MEVKVYGIKNCNTIKKTLDFFENHSVKIDFVDYKKNSPTLSFLEELDDIIGISTVINKNGTTFKKLSNEDKALMSDKDKAFQLLMKNSSMIKRPLIQFSKNEWIVGFDETFLIKRLEEK